LAEGVEGIFKGRSRVWMRAHLGRDAAEGVDHDLAADRLDRVDDDADRARVERLEGLRQRWVVVGGFRRRAEERALTIRFGLAAARIQSPKF
jgi:hypothetical protein